MKDVMFEEGIPIVGGGNRYYVADTEEEVASAMDTLQGRITSTAERRMALKRAAK